MTETMAEDRPDTTQEQPEPTSNGDPPADDPLSQINELYSRFDEYAKKVKPKLDDAGLRDFATETSNVDVAHGQALNRKDPGHLRDAVNAATTNIDRLLPADSVEFTETETAQDTGNSAEAEVHQEPEAAAAETSDQFPISDELRSEYDTAITQAERTKPHLDEPGQARIQAAIDACDDSYKDTPLAVRQAHAELANIRSEILSELPEQARLEIEETISDDGRAAFDERYAQQGKELEERRLVILPELTKKQQQDMEAGLKSALRPVANEHFTFAARLAGFEAAHAVITSYWHSLDKPEPAPAPAAFGTLDYERPPTDAELDEDEDPPDPILTTDTNGIIMAHERNTLLYSRPGGGKTWMAVDVAIHVALGGGGVAYYNYDTGSLKGNKRLWKRFRGHKLWTPELRNRIRIIACSVPPREELNERRPLVNDWLLNKHPNPERSLVIIDTISGSGGAFNKPERYKAWFTEILAPHANLGIGTLSLGHEAKVSPKGPFGSVLSLGDCDTAIRAACLGRQKMPNKKHSGQFTLYIDKDREADADAQEGDPVAIVDCAPHPGGLHLTYRNPDPKIIQKLNETSEQRDLAQDFLDLLGEQANNEWEGKVALRNKLECDMNDLTVVINTFSEDGIITVGKAGRKERYRLRES